MHFLRVDFVVLPVFVQGEVSALFCAGAVDVFAVSSEYHPLRNGLVSLYTICRTVRLLQWYSVV